MNSPIATIGGRPVRYRVGASKGHFVQGTPSPTAIDTGTTYVTDQRVVFRGGKQTRECAFAKLVGYDHTDDGSTVLSVSNRQTPTVIHYGRAVADEFADRYPDDSQRCADAQARRGADYPAQLMDRLDVHHPLGRVQRVFHQADQVGAAGQHVGLAPGSRQQRGGFLEARWIRVFEGLHYAFLPSSASST